jgi:hypothetical protein
LILAADPGVIRIEEGRWQTDDARLATLAMADQVRTAVDVANASDLVKLLNAPRPFSDGASNAIQKAGELLPKLTGLVPDLQAFVHGARARAHWWGLTIDMKPESCDAFVRVVTTDLTALGAAASLFTTPVPEIATVVPIAALVGAGLGAWVRAGKGAGGARLGFYLWTLPWVTPIAAG